MAEQTDVSIARSARIMRIARANTLIAIVLTSIDVVHIDAVLDQLEALRLTRRQIICLWSHHADADKARFIALVMAEPPTSCPKATGEEDGADVGCNWERIADESHIFGPPKAAAEEECAFAGCDEPATASCGRCYLVRYCSPMCQRRDWARHGPECQKTIKALEMAATYGREYARRIFRNTLRVSDAQFERLWVTHSTSQHRTCATDTNDPA